LYKPCTAEKFVQIRTYLRYFCNLKNVPKVNNRPKGENSANLVTLSRALACNIAFQRCKQLKKRENSSVSKFPPPSSPPFPPLLSLASSLSHACGTLKTADLERGEGDFVLSVGAEQGCQMFIDA
jgi:hypothetical protein